MRRLLRQFWIVLGAAVAVFVLSWVYYMPNGDQRGVWRSATGGTIITLGALRAKVYSETNASCVHQLTIPAHLKLIEWARGAWLEQRGVAQWLHLDGSLGPMRYDRVATLPDACGPVNVNAAPRATFDALWAAMDENYAFFDLHGVDWTARRALAPAPDEMMSDEALFSLLAQTLDDFDDGHIQLSSPQDSFSPANAPDWFPDPVPFDRDDLWQAARDAIGAPLTRVDQTAIEYIQLPDGIGYVLIREMDMLTPFGARQEPAMARAFVQVADAMRDASAIIIDVRYNPGGSDSVALGIASHFTREPIDVFTKTTRNGDSQTAPYTVTLMPYDQAPLDQPVIVLTSKLTGSAAEIFTLALRELPNVTVMGEATSGSLSDMLEFTLPNGWSLGLSHQTYRSLSGDSFEAIGIPPDITVETDAAALALGEDTVLRAAFARARTP